MGNPHRGIVDIEIGGKQRQLRLDLNALAEVEDRLKLGGVTDIIPLLEKLSMKAMRTLLWAGLLHNEPELTEREVGTWDIDVSEVAPVINRMLRLALGIAPPVFHPEGNAERLGASSGTGQKS